jgi:hypothetical protein
LARTKLPIAAAQDASGILALDAFIPKSTAACATGPLIKRIAQKS